MYQIYLAGCTLGAVQRWSLFSFAEIRVVWMAAPQLFAWIKCTELTGENKCNVLYVTERGNYMVTHIPQQMPNGLPSHFCGPNKLIRQFNSYYL